MLRCLATTWLLLAGVPLSSYAAEPVVAVRVTHPIVRESADYDFVALVEPLPRQPLRATQDGVVEKVHCRPGDRVQPGDLLFSLDAKKLQADLRRAEDEARDAADALRNAERLLQNALQPLDVPSLQAKRELAAVTLQIAKKNVTSIQEALAATQIQAPTAGEIREINVKPGDTVASGARFATLLGTIVQHDPVLVSFQADERTLLYLRKLAAEQEEAKDAQGICPVALQLRGHDEFQHHGTAKCSDNRLDARTGRIRFLAEFTQPSAELLAVANKADALERTAIVRMTIGKSQKQTLVPTAAIGYDHDSQPYVLVVDKHDIAQARPVKLAVSLANFQVLSEGPHADEWVVIGAEDPATNNQDQTLSPDDFTSDIRTLRIKPGTKVAPVRVELTVPSPKKTTPLR